MVAWAWGGGGVWRPVGSGHLGDGQLVKVLQGLSHLLRADVVNWMSWSLRDGTRGELESHGTPCILFFPQNTDIKYLMFGLACQDLYQVEYKVKCKSRQRLCNKFYLYCLPLYFVNSSMWQETDKHNLIRMQYRKKAFRSSKAESTIFWRCRCCCVCRICPWPALIASQKTLDSGTECVYRYVNKTAGWRGG